MVVAGGLSSGIFSVKIDNNFELENVALPIIFCLNGSDLIKFAQKKCLTAYALPQPPISSNLLGGTSPYGEGGGFYVGEGL